MGNRTDLWKQENEAQIEGWIDHEGGRFEEAYYYLRATTRFKSGVCFVGAWLSLSEDDRGDLDGVGKLANWLGISRWTVNAWRVDFLLDDWAEQLRLMQLHGLQLGKVDEVTYKQAIKPESPVDARRLYYQRAGVLGQEITLHTRTQKEKMAEWLQALRDEGDDDGTVAELEAEVIDLPALVVPASRGTDTDTPV